MSLPSFSYEKFGIGAEAVMEKMMNYSLTCRKNISSLVQDSVIQLDYFLIDKIFLE